MLRVMIQVAAHSLFSDWFTPTIFYSLRKRRLCSPLSVFYRTKTQVECVVWQNNLIRKITQYVALSKGCWYHPRTPSRRLSTFTIVDKSPWDTYLISRIVCVLLLKFEKKRCFSFQNALLFPLPTPYNVENKKKLLVVVFNIVCGVVGWGTRLGRWSCIRVWRVRKSVKSANLSQDFCPWL